MTDVRTRPGTEDPAVRRQRRQFARRARAGRVRRWRPLLLLLALVAVVAGAVWLLLFSSVLSASRVEVTGPSSMSDDAVRRVADVPLGGPLARVDLDAVRQRVADVPRVAAVEVTRGWPDAVRLVVTDRVPVAALVRGTGWQVMDADGVEWGRFDDQPAGLPVVRAAPRVREVAVREAARVVSALPAPLADRTSAVDVATIDRISLALRDGRTVQWGSAEQSELKARVLSTLLASREARRVEGDRATRIDVSVPDQPTLSR